MPYLAMIDRLRSFLKKPTASLVLSGYSFRDEHLNEVIVQGLQGTQTAIGFAVLHGSLDCYPEALKLARERSNLTLLARDAAVIGGRTGEWLSQEGRAELATSSDWVRWTESDIESSAGMYKAELLLGDFAVFGRFLHQMLGTSTSSSEVA